MGVCPEHFFPIELQHVMQVMAGRMCGKRAEEKSLMRTSLRRLEEKGFTLLFQEPTG